MTIHVFVRVRYLVFSVSDTGRGIARDDLEHIFQAFTRLSSAQGVEGFGLGLAITRQLVDLMGGRIDVRSVEWVLWLVYDHWKKSRRRPAILKAFSRKRCPR